MYTKIGFTVLSLGVIATVGCERRERANEREREREVQVSPARPAEPGTEHKAAAKPSTTNAKAVASITEARCDREARCSNIGADHKFKSWQECQQKITAKSSDKIGAPECPGGVDSYELSECLTEIRNEKCGNPLDTLERVAACNAADLCMK